MEMQVTVSVEFLKAKLVENLEKHNKTFQEALEVYRSKMIEDLNNKLDLIKSGKTIDHTIRLPLPENHAEDYIRAIKMLQVHEEPTIVLDTQTYTVFVDDQWHWSRSFLANTASYAAPK